VITLTAAATALPLNGSTDILAQVLESAGTPPQDGTLITFTTTLGSFQPPEAETRGGRVTVKFLAGSQNGTATIVASSGGASASGNNALRIAIGAAAVGHVLIDANPGTVSANGGTSTITSVVFDINGNPLSGVQVAFSTDAGTVSPSVVAADANGQAQTTLTTNKTAKVTATAGNPATGGGTGTGTTTPTSTQTATVTVTVNAAAAISFGTITPATPTAGQTVTFALTYGTATGASPIARVIMDWGDGSPAQTFPGQPTTVSHNYSGAGSFLVRATATDTFGDTSTATTALQVGARPQPTVSITASANPTAGTVTTFTVSATPATGSNATITSLRVDFGDGTPQGDLGASSGASIPVQHVYQNPGTYRATAIATDSNGGSGSAATVIVVGSITVALTSTQTTSGLNTTVTFTATVSPSGTNISSFAWNFGDGQSATTTGNTVQHPYITGSGQKQVTVTATTTTGQTATGQTVVTP
jgi:adhesin/invasin